MKINDTLRGTEFSLNCGGVAVIVSYNGALDVDVALGDGFIKKVQIGDLRKGQVSDKSIPTVCGVGYIGNGDHKPSFQSKDTAVYSIWRAMIHRCYSLKRDRYHNYDDCIVCSEWHSFQNYANWYIDNHVEGFEVDKDIKIPGNKVYSPDACMFVSKRKNTEAASAKHYKFKSPQGEIVEIYNLSKFCLENDLQAALMWKVNSGERDHHKGWEKV